MKRTFDKPVTRQQIKALHVIFAKQGMSDDDRHDYISWLTGGRTNSTKGLTFDEATKIISMHAQGEKARQYEEARKLVGIIYKLSFEISFLNKNFKGCNSAEDYEMNKAKINAFCRNKTRFRKNINEMTLEELHEVRRQFEKIARKENENIE